MISRTSRYALHLIGVLAARPGERLGGADMARLTGIPANYLTKILNQLAKHGIVDSQKGWGGGFLLRDESLGRPICDILEIFEGPQKTRQKDCVFGLPSCNAEHPCPLHQEWEAVRDGYHRMISSRTISELVFHGRPP